MSRPNLAGKIAIVTGASRGIGKGIALQLGQAGATVYITGRTLKSTDSKLKGSLEDTAKEVEDRGGKCIPVQCDHSKDEDVTKLFDKVQREQSGQLDILVNNAYAAVHSIANGTGKPFWHEDRNPAEHWDTVNNVGLRNHYICTTNAARLMVPRKQGLIVNISSAGGLRYLFDVPYGIGKAAVDRMAADCAHELRRHKVTCISLWPGAVHTENVKDIIADAEASGSQVAFSKLKDMFEAGETTEVAGLCVANLASDPGVHKKTGRILLSGDLASEYGFKDVDGRPVANMRSISGLLLYGGWVRLASWIPGWICIPKWILHQASNKF